MKRAANWGKFYTTQAKVCYALALNGGKEHELASCYRTGPGKLGNVLE
jgi:hypothetical protein